MIFALLFLRSLKNRNQWTGTLVKCTGREFWSEDNHNAILILGGKKNHFLLQISCSSMQLCVQESQLLSLWFNENLRKAIELTAGMALFLHYDSFLMRKMIVRINSIPLNFYTNYIQSTILAEGTYLLQAIQLSSCNHPSISHMNTGAPCQEWVLLFASSQHGKMNA